MAEIIIKMDTDNSTHHIDTHISGTGQEISLMIATLVCNQSKSNGFDYRMLLKYIEATCEQISNEI